MGFVRIGEALVRRRRRVVVMAVLFLVVAGALGGDVAERLSIGGFENEGAASSEADRLLDERFDAGEPNVVLVVGAGEAATGVDDPAVAAEGLRITEELGATEGMTEVASYWSLGSAPPLRAEDSSSALVLGRLEGTEDEVDERIAILSEQFTVTEADVAAGEAAGGAGVTVGVGGLQEAFRVMGETIEADLLRAELLAFPLTLLLLLFIFRSVVSALLPLGVGLFAILGTFLVLDVLAGMTLVSIYALNITTALGLGLAIDYSLFVVSRYREERDGGHDTRAAVVRTVGTAGRAVVVSGLTVALSIGALLVFPIAFLRSFAYAGIPVVALAVVGAVVVLPALLAILGDRVDAWSIPTRSRGPVGAGAGRFWEKVARSVMARPVPVITVVVTALLVLGAPFLRVAFGLPDDRVLPEDTPVRVVNDTIRTDYTSNDTGAVSVVLPGTASDDPAIDDYAARLSALADVARVDAASGIYIEGARVLDEAPSPERFEPVGAAVVAGGGEGGTWLSVVPSVEPISAEGEDLVVAVRAEAAPGEVLVGGQSAMLVDLKDGIFERLPLALGLIAISTFVLLLLMFGSVLVPIKALVLNTLSLTATFGAMVWIFQDGNLAGPLGFTATGFLDTTIPVLMFCIAFGLSMDYEVFLLSRIKEQVDHGADDTDAVAIGLARTGRIISAAAALMSVVFLAFATSEVSFIKLFGLGLTLAVLMDATIVRATLVPAFMRLAGRANWWAPAWVHRIVDRVGLSEAAAERAVVDVRDTVEVTPVEGSEVPAGEREPVTIGDPR
jgi:RND superfamily putative drug exporter